MNSVDGLVKHAALAVAALSASALFAAPGDATVEKWENGAKGAFMLMFDDGWPSAWQAAMPALEARGLPADFYIIPDKGEFKVFEKKWKECFRNPLFRFGNHTWSHNGFDDYDGAVKEFGDCTKYLRENVPGKEGRLISYAQPGVKAGRWNINAEQEAKICKEQGLVARPTFRDHGATYHLKNKDDMLAKAKKAVAEGIAEYVIFHGVAVDDPKRGYQDFWAMPTKEYIPFFDELAVLRDRNELWVADHVSVHQYETERASAKVKKLDAPPSALKLAVTCDADAKLYDYPLTLKVEVPKAWKAAKYRQGKDGEVGLSRVEGGFAFVKAVPNGVPVGIVESKDVPPARPAPKAAAAAAPARSEAPAAAPLKRADVRWTWCGWGGGGWFWSAAADPVNPDVFYMGGDVNGIWKSTDGCRSWFFVNDGLQNYGVYSLAVAPSSAKTVYALTENGVAASFDAAKTWIPCKDTMNGALAVSASRGGSIHAVAVDPKSPKTVYAGGKSGRAAKSTDGGATWEVMDYMSSRQPDEGEVAKPASGAGYGVIGVAANANDWANYVRIQKMVDQNGADWSACDKIGAKVFLPKDAPAGMQATIVVQSGGWDWKEGPMKPLEPGKWTALEYPMSAYKDAKAVNMVHFVVRTQGKGFKGNVGIDDFAATGAGGKRIEIGEWNGADVEGWRVSPDANTKSVTKSFSTSKSPKSAPSGAPVCTIAVSGANPNVVLLCQQKHGLFRSADAGRTWTHVKGAPAGARTVVWGGKSAPTTWFGAFDKSGVFVSKDDGLTWTTLNAPVEEGLGARDIVASPADGGKTLLAIVGQGFNGYIAATYDGGATWTKNRNFKPDRAANPTLPEDGGRTKMSGLENLAMSPADPSRAMMAGNWNPCATHTAGREWFESVRGADITCFHDIQHLGRTTYGAAMDEGTCATKEDGDWTALYPRRWKGGYSGHHWRVLPQKLKDGRTRVVCTVSPWAHNGTQPVRVVVSEDGGKTFEEAKGLPDYRTHANTMWGEGHGRAISADPTNPDVIYLGIDGDPEKGNAGGGIFKSTDGGHNWKQLPNQPGSRRMMYGIKVDPTNPKRIVWGACGSTAGVYVSEDAGESWKKAPNLGDWIFNVEVSAKGTVYAGGNQLWRSDDHGKSFRAITNLKGVTVVGIACDPADEKRMWISASTWDGNRAGGIYETADGGKTWTDITGDNPYPKPLVLRYNATTRELWAAGPAAFKLKR